jgi:hypothetical protein
MSSLLGPNILLRTLFSNSLSLCSSIWKTHRLQNGHQVYILFQTMIEQRGDCIIIASTAMSLLLSNAGLPLHDYCVLTDWLTA